MIASTSGSPVQLASTNFQVATIENGWIKPVAPGTTTIVATLKANTNYYDGGRIEQPLVVTKYSQTITFQNLPAVKLKDLTVGLKAVSTSGLPISYQSTNPAVASVSGSTVTIHAAGSTTITASQGGNDNFLPAPNVSQVLVITDGSQSITFNNPGNKVLGAAPFNLTATSTSNLAIAYTTTSNKISISGSQVTILKAGMVIIQANQPGDDTFEPAIPVEVTFCINPPRPVITESGHAPDIEFHSSNEIGNQWYLRTYQ